MDRKRPSRSVACIKPGNHSSSRHAGAGGYDRRYADRGSPRDPPIAATGAVHSWAFHDGCIALQPRSVFLFLVIWTSQHWILATGLASQTPSREAAPESGK